MKIWNDEEVKSLFSCVEQNKAANGSLVRAFALHAKKFSRRPNSVRNYYYHEVDNLLVDKIRAKRLGINLNEHQKSHFENFDKVQEGDLFGEIDSLTKSGLSVRAACLKLSGGDLTKMTRYQNKYQNMKRKIENHNKTEKKLQKNQQKLTKSQQKSTKISEEINNKQKLEKKSLKIVKNNKLFEQNQPKLENNSQKIKNNSQNLKNNSQIIEKTAKLLENMNKKYVKNQQKNINFQAKNAQFDGKIAKIGEFVNFKNAEQEQSSKIIPFKIPRTLSDADINSLFLGLVRLIKKSVQDEMQQKQNELLGKYELVMKNSDRIQQEYDKQTSELEHVKAEFAKFKRESAAAKNLAAQLSKENAATQLSKDNIYAKNHAPQLSKKIAFENRLAQNVRSQSKNSSLESRKRG